MLRPKTKAFARSERLRLDVEIPNKEMKTRAFAEIEKAGWSSFAEYMRGIIWLASQGVMLIKRPDKKPRKYKRHTRAKRKARPGYVFDEVSHRWRKPAPATINVMEMD